MMVVLTIKEMSYLMVDLFGDLVGPFRIFIYDMKLHTHCGRQNFKCLKTSFFEKSL